MDKQLTVDEQVRQYAELSERVSELRRGL